MPGQYIVVYKDQWDGKITNPVAQQALQFVNERISELGVADSAVKHRYEYTLRGFAAKLTQGQLKALQQDPRVNYIEQDRKFKAFSTAKASSEAGISTSSGQTVPWGIFRVNGGFDGMGKKAWILDTGIDLNHPDLNVDVVNSVSFVAQESADDQNGHGTHVAGILAAQNNNQDVLGVAAGASVVAVKVLDQDGNGTLSDVVDGVNYVTSKASQDDVINMSLAGPASTSIDDAVTNAANAGLRFTIAAGNGKQHAGNVSPARVEHSNVWTVSAFKQGDAFAVSFDCNPNLGSNFGNPPVEFSAPGNNISSLAIGGGTTVKCGTSMAAPHVAGLLLGLGTSNPILSDGTVSNDPDNTPDEIASPVISAPDVTGFPQNGRAHIEWDPVPHATNYEVWYKSTEPGATGQEFVLISTQTSTSYDGVSLNHDQSGNPNYFPYNASYKVKANATSPYLGSGYSNTASFIYYQQTGCILCN